MICPDVSDFAILDFAAYEPIIEVGYEAAKDQLVSWLSENRSSLQSSGQNTSSLRSLVQTLDDLESVIDGLSEDGIP
jgi:hypothetical protein